MKQLVLDISPLPRATLENFVPGENAELLERLRQLVAGSLRETILYLWGGPGSGRTHLLSAVAQSAPGTRVADDVQHLDEAGQISLFNAINEARESGGRVLAAGDAPPAQLALRADLRTRLAWGLVYQVKPPGDAGRTDFLRTEAARRGIRLQDEAIEFLLRRARRDLRSLAALVEDIDRLSLERQRPVTLALLRDALQPSATDHG